MGSQRLLPAEPALTFGYQNSPQIGKIKARHNWNSWSSKQQLIPKRLLICLGSWVSFVSLWTTRFEMAQGAHSDVSQIAEVNLQLLLIGILRILHCMGHHDGHHGHYFSNQNDPTLLHLGRLFRPFLVGPKGLSRQHQRRPWQPPAQQKWLQPGFKFEIHLLVNKVGSWGSGQHSWVVKQTQKKVSYYRSIFILDLLFICFLILHSKKRNFGQRCFSDFRMIFQHSWIRSRVS